MFLVVLAVVSTGCGVSTQQEVEIGQSNVQQINQQLPIVSDAEVNRYINVLGDSIARLTSRPDLPWTFYIVNAPEINAFAVPGGFIYVNRGLIEKTRTLSQLAGVLGHEIGHVVERHSVEQMGQMNAANIGVGLACVLTNVCSSQAAQVGINAAGTALFSKFSRDDEREADAVGIDNVVRAGIHPKGVPEMFQILLETRQTSPGLVDGWFATHPTEEERIRETQALVNAINPAILRTLTENTTGYNNFKARVRSLPLPRR
ncbi:MAG TPA: M48 family metallopeptidase [Gemmatimonadaceae bacterium]|nr:M48 family metallopeptidase [Gemmatimonadaceae bacterium]